MPDGLLHDLAELLELLDEPEISPFALGMHSRRVVEQLVQHSLVEVNETVPLFVGINLLRQRGVDPWLISCLHQIRCFGNWMVHPQGPGQRRKVEVADVLAVLASLQRVLAEVPWELGEALSGVPQKRPIDLISGLFIQCLQMAQEST